MPPRVSIIVPAYNGGRYLPSALATVAAQTLSDWELIIVDNGSTDDTPAILAQAPADARRQVARLPQPGVSAARNAGLARAQSDLVAFLDVDDAWRPNYLATLCAALAAAPAAVAAFCGWQYMDEAGQPLPQAVLLAPAEAGQLATNLLWRNSLVPSGVVARRAAVQEVGGFDPNLSGTEDWDLWLRLSARGAFVAVPQVLVWYRAHAQSATENVLRMERARLKLHAKHLGSLDEPLDQWPAARRRAVGLTYFNTALGYFWRNDAAQGRAKARQALAVWPGLLALDEFYYELACANQPRGRRGFAADLDLPAGEARLRDVLLAGAEATGQPLRGYLGRADLILAQLARNAGRPADSRAYALRALTRATGRERGQALRLLAGTLLPRSLIQTLRGRRKPQPTAQPAAPP